MAGVEFCVVGLLCALGCVGIDGRTGAVTGVGAGVATGAEAEA